MTVVALLAAAAGTARAAGVEHPDVGTVAIGRGGADAASPESGLALQYNPAGLARQSGVRVTLDANLAWQDVRFTPATGEPAVSNGAPPFFAPAAAASWGLGPVGPLPALTVALGATGPAAIGKLSYPGDGAQRYALVSSDTTIAYLSGGVGATLARWLDAGVTLQLVKGHATFTQAVWSGETPGTEMGQDSVAHVDVTSGFIPTGVFGLTVRPSPRVAIGVSYRPRFTFDASGTLLADLPKTAQAVGAFQTGASARFLLPMPDVVRAGVQVRPTPRWLVEADVVLERWSTLDALRLLPKDITIESPNLGSGPKTLPDIVLPHGYEDAWSVRLGGERELVPGRLTARAGVLRETSAVPLASTSVDFPNWERTAVSVGASVAIPGTPVTVDVAWAHHFLPTRTVTNSAVAQVVTPCLSNGCTTPPPTVVGNGRYEASLDVVSLSARVAFRQPGLDASATRP
jgi:long-subunit fatty acid transport protein